MLCVSQGKITHSKAPSNYLKKIEAVLYKRVISDPKWVFFPPTKQTSLCHLFLHHFGGNEKQGGGVSHYGLAIYIFKKTL
jgi:hypothetical protein